MNAGEERVQSSRATGPVNLLADLSVLMLSKSGGLCRDAARYPGRKRFLPEQSETDCCKGFKQDGRIAAGEFRGIGQYLPETPCAGQTGHESQHVAGYAVHFQALAAVK